MEYYGLSVHQYKRPSVFLTTLYFHWRPQEKRNPDRHFIEVMRQ
ncbi:hypothetical protein D1BOALGB6SA_2362 [Olavius sp. associated proteobacterium Delta 1]|nr:hypothetical protein D1BOALGB6SA_2362 [Olavius sp. associated proteobacterium Delta 1]